MFDYEYLALTPGQILYQNGGINARIVNPWISRFATKRPLKYHTDLEDRK